MRPKLPHSLRYPITITELLKQPGDNVERAEALFVYTYKTTVREGPDDEPVERTYPSRYESNAEGTLTKWIIKKGLVILGPGQEIAEVEETCSHDMVFGGLCANCGKDVTEQSFVTTTADTSRANINMIHDNVALTVSRDEALRIEGEAKRRLLTSRKLSLVVDLDQTIIHATVDPTVDEWQKDPENPNYDAVKDVQKFQLTDDGPGGKGTWYYIKLRPGLKGFLENISKLYELHIYTMGTRAYAQNIAKLVDPERKIFGDRILSRDESGSMVAKNLQRLFPVDTKMVVIIDDRGDVWHWNANLVKVTPFSFFPGIGDLNSSFLPKRAKSRSMPKEKETLIEKEENGNTSPEESVQPAPTTNGDSIKSPENQVSALEQLVSMGGGDNPEILKEQNETQDKVLTAQLEERPLLQKQKQLDEEDEQADEDPEHPHQRHPLLNNDDDELHYLELSLTRVHTEFFATYDRQLAGSRGGRLAELRGTGSVVRNPNADSDLELIPDIKNVMPAVKRRVLEGVHIVFSGVIPLDTDPTSAEIVIWAKSFGARIQTKVRGKSTTHVVAARNRTAKVRQAVSRGNGRIKVVRPDWLTTCIIHWEKVDEGPFLLQTDAENIGRPFPGEEDEADEEENLSESESIESDDKETDADATESDADGPVPRHIGTSKGPVLRITTPSSRDAGGLTDDEDLAAFAPPALVDPESPVGGDKKEWDDMHAELQDFLGTDEDDSDAESSVSDLGLASRGINKRGIDELNSDGESDSGTPMKKKVALRGSALRGSALRGEVVDKKSEQPNGLMTPAVTVEREGDEQDMGGVEGGEEEDGEEGGSGSGWSDLEEEGFDVGDESDEEAEL